jgi:hypothetical protein
MIQRINAKLFTATFCFFNAVAFIALASATAIAGGQKFSTISCAIHIHSTFSGKEFSLEKIVQDAREAKLDSIIITDHDIMRWEYGLMPLRGLLKRTIEHPSVLSTGPQHYLNTIKQLQTNNPGIVIIPGVESTAFYYWSGSPFNKSLVLNSCLFLE